MLIRSWIVLVFTLGLINTPPQLTDETYAQIRNAVLPAPEEVKWQEIHWYPTFWEAVTEAQRTEKPILLWAMNGHPLACT